MDIMESKPFSEKVQKFFGHKLSPRNENEKRAYKNAFEVLTMIRDGTLDPSSLEPADRQPVVAYLRLEGHNIDEIAQLFGVSTHNISQDLYELSKDRVKLIKRINLFEVAGRLIEMAQHLSRKSRREGDYSGAWKIERELMESLQSLGFVYRAPRTAKIATIHAEVKEGHDKLASEIGGEQDQVISALNEMLSGIKDDQQRLVHIDDGNSN